MRRPACGYHVLMLLVLMREGRAVTNDATETRHVPPSGAVVQRVHHVPTNESMNQARNGGRHPVHAGLSENSQMGCRELRSTKYISDGQCTSLNPVKELVCAGECLPAHLLPNWIGSGGSSGRSWGRRDAQEWRCVIDRSRTQRIRLRCQDGSSRTYRITVVTSCKCKRYSRQQNQSETTRLRQLESPEGRKTRKRFKWTGPGRSPRTK
ncbi:LOW QUALITY PROTEIN: sclerostin domain-containing protein 1b [Lampris incognitus]|uniref:LOW QUALITY PROTEIN: sclerostin domain-containing protein 1b n=1 Tax=Lampris incognitus TaxID=2546036 RepID=UPI0024B534F3|nr:LOW QUALITY PROTEIN: sclerostin domain-containing protein 1b [Lampris incognitus]